jgi:hypothetical protein
VIRKNIWKEIIQSSSNGNMMDDFYLLLDIFPLFLFFIIGKHEKKRQCWRCSSMVESLPSIYEAWVPPPVLQIKQGSKISSLVKATVLHCI